MWLLSMCKCFFYEIVQYTTYALTSVYIIVHLNGKDSSVTVFL